MPKKSSEAAICDANILIDFVAADEDILRKMVAYWGTVYVPDRVLNEAKQLPSARAEELGLTIIETPLELPIKLKLSGPDRACLFYVIKHKWACIVNDRTLRKECEKAGGRVVWGLEMLLLLVSAKQITKARAKDIAQKINEANPEITDGIIKDFLRKLKDSQPD